MEHETSEQQVNQLYCIKQLTPYLIVYTYLEPALTDINSI